MYLLQGTSVSLSKSLIFLFYLVIKEAAIMKKHNLFEDNLNMPCESVSSLTDLKTPSGSAQTTPAKKPSTARAEMSDTETQSDETLIVTEKISWEKDSDDRKSSDKEAVTAVNMAGDQASKSEEVVVTDISEKQESLSATLREVAEEKSALENEDTVKAEFVANTEKELKTQQKAVEEKVAPGTETAVKDSGASPKKELKVHKGAMEEKVTSESQTARDAAFVSDTEKESKAQEEVSEIKLTSPHDNVAETEILGNAKKKIKVEKEIMEEVSHRENVVGTGLEEDSRKESNDQGTSTETGVISQDENTGKGGVRDNPEKESKSEGKSCKFPDDVNEIRSLLMVTVEIPADTPAENIKEICEGEILKLQDHNKEDDELSNMAVAEIQVSQTMMNKDAAECTEFKEDRSSSCSLGTDGTNLVNVSKGACNMAQAEWLVESSDTPQEAKAEVEIKQSVWYAGVGSCESDRLQPEEHTENVPEGKRLDGEKGGAGNSHAIPVEVGSFFHNPAENADTKQVPILDTENPRTGLLDVPVSLVLEQGEVSAVEVTGDTEAGEGEGKPEDESSSQTKIKSTEGEDIFTEKNREDSYAQQNSEE